MRTLSPAEVQAMIGLPPDRLRDWRRRGFLDGIGVQEGAPGATKVNWVYRSGDVLHLAVASEITKLGLGIEVGLRLANISMLHVIAWLGAPSSAHLKDPRYIVAWPSEEGENLMGSPVGSLTAVRLGDLNRISLYTAGKAIILDAQALAANLPPALVALATEQWVDK